MTINDIGAVILMILINNVLNFNLKRFDLNLEIIKNNFNIRINIGLDRMEKDTLYMKM
ncbi:hypothetical protein B0P06_002234 [Clostridium saccharoperbutylacetonicum]|uniref:Uncharacterized protein n=1 Tax=Clostridium saccharoperbutylacetonicum N1-4(HMT) TaxID=931276 RepID=M1N7S6_9CLOT|nr:hypothetical protein [Clostridium saccharoperbutylacetonicum]AGF59427.1 hypothetical protein Cspa_c57020 [Clostridium saccharoperbutylacetonicum N1-4(HMT)]NRT59780.1 hypothetical protein [Clostridium saccharoperbutylacetonicum]NSB23092.1 hypothetical protein [Clostridium saccharoperbutylacetonicum]NSB42463.1 hypothetical protein [Clostridium saccharoperbutylacetonicum]